MSWVEPETLRKLRERLALRREDVEKEASKLAHGHFAPLPAAQLQGYEQGSAAPELRQLETLAEIYGCPVGYFFLDEPPQRRLPLSFRGLAPGKEEHFSPGTQRTLQRFLDLADWITALIEEQGIEWRVPPQFPGSKKGGLGRTVEEERSRFGFDEGVRQGWQSADQAFAWWRRQIEDQGVSCLQMKLQPKDIRGASLWTKGRYPFILVNHQDAETATGRTFTLLHEYAHLQVDPKGVACDFRGRDAKTGVEPAANRFAADMLLPAREFEQHLRKSNAYRFQQGWSDAELDRLRAPFFVSRNAVSIRLEQMQLAPPSFYDQKWNQWEQRYAQWRPWGRGRHPTKRERKAAELGSAPLRILTTLAERGTLPILDASYALDMKVEKVPEFLEWSKKQVLAKR